MLLISISKAPGSLYPRILRIGPAGLIPFGPVAIICCPIIKYLDSTPNNFFLFQTVRFVKTDLRQATSDDFEFAFSVKKQAMGPHITKQWDWNENFQLTLHTQRWNEKPWFVINGDGKAIGTVSIHEYEDHVRFGEFYLLAEYQARGIGTKIFQEFLKSCDEKNLAVKLEHLKWNPVGSLYGRNGFKLTSENDTHCFLTRTPMPVA